MRIKNSRRLSFSIMTVDDAQLLFKLDQDSVVMRFINGGVLTRWQEINEIYLPRMKAYTNEQEGWGLWKILLKKNKEFIGWILVRPVDFFTDNPDFENLELGWRFMRQHWGKGYAMEAALSIKQALQQHGQIKKLSAIANAENHASINIMKKLGMKYLKTYLHKDPIFSEEVVYTQNHSRCRISAREEAYIFKA